MRGDLFLAILLALAALSGGVPMSLILALYPNTPRWVLHSLFYGSIALTAILLVASFYVATSNPEGQMFGGNKIAAIAIMIVCAVGFSLSLRWLLSQDAKTAVKEKGQPAKVDITNKPGATRSLAEAIEQRPVVGLRFVYPQSPALGKV